MSTSLHTHNSHLESSSDQRLDTLNESQKLGNYFSTVKKS